MTRTWVLNLAVGVVTTVVVGLAAGPGWPAWVMGAILALALAVGVAIQASTAGELHLDLRPTTYAIGAAVMVLIGAVLSGAETNAFWSVGVIVGIVTAPYAARAAASDR